MCKSWTVESPKMRAKFEWKNDLLFFFFCLLKIFSWFTKTRKPRKKNTKDISSYNENKSPQSANFAHMVRFTTQLAIVVLGKKVYRFSTAIASYFARDGLRVRYPQMTHGKRVIIFSVSDNRPSLLPQNVYTAVLGTLSYEYCSSPTAAWQTQMEQALPCFLTQSIPGQ